jgi:hypothetical protein
VYASIALAVADGKYHLAIVASYTEAGAVTGPGGTTNLCLELCQDVKLNLAGTPAFSAFAKVSIQGPGAGTFGQAPATIVVAAGNSLLGTNVRLSLLNLNISGAGTFSVTENDSVIENCVFTDATLFQFNRVGQALLMTGNYFETPTELLFYTGLGLSPIANIHNNTFVSTVDFPSRSISQDSLIFSSNVVLGSCTVLVPLVNSVIVNNVINGLTTVMLSRCNITSNTAQSGAITVSGDMSSCTIANNIASKITFVGACTSSVVSGNSLPSGIVTSGSVLNCVYTSNICGSGIVFGTLGSPTAVSDSTISFNSISTIGVVFNGTSTSINQNTVTGNSTDGAITVTPDFKSSAGNNVVTGNRAAGGYAGWTTFLLQPGYPNDILDTGVAPIVAGVGLNRI